MPVLTAPYSAGYLIDGLSLKRQLMLVLTFNILLIASSYIQVPLPFSPVPITAQTIVVLACGLFMGPAWGVATVMTYLMQGALGLPVFAGGAAGLARIIGPTGGYLAGFIAGAWLVGVFSSRVAAMTYWKLIGVLALGTMVIFACGLAVLSLFVPLHMVPATGLYPFIPGAIVKIIVVASGLTLYKRLRMQG